jgi:hypothetical protein
MPLWWKTGILGSNGHYWRTVRRATLQGFKYFLTKEGKTSVEVKLLKEVEHLQERLLSKQTNVNTPNVYLPDALSYLVFSVLLNIVASELCIHSLDNLLETFQSSSQIFSMIL